MINETAKIQSRISQLDGISHQIESVPHRAALGKLSGLSNHAAAPWEEAIVKDFSHLYLDPGIQLYKDAGNSLAYRVRSIDQSMTQIDTYISRMKDMLKAVVKNYPPFPQGNEERIKLLKSFNAMRKQIDQLTFPPDKNRCFAKFPLIIGTNDAGTFEDETQINDAAAAVEGRLITAGERILTIPGFKLMAEEPSEEEIITTLEDMIIAGERFKQDQANLTAETMQFGFVFKKMHDALPELVVMTEGAAIVKSIEVERHLQQEPFEQLTQAKSYFYSYLRN